MKIRFTILFLVIAVLSFGQTKEYEKYLKADSLLQKHQTKEAYDLFKQLSTEISKNDTLYSYVMWYYIGATTELENKHRMNQEFSSSLQYGLEALNLIKENKVFYDEKFSEREAWMVKNIIVSYFGLGKLDEAKKYKAILYEGYKNKTLPNGISGYFNFDFFTLDNKNIWGYEWYPELPDDRFSTSFTKVVYYVYSTNPDGSDNEQLYRFHVLMFHQSNEDTKFDYILEKQQEQGDMNISGSYYNYTYKKDIDYKKLKADIIEIIKGDIKPDTRRTIPQKSSKG